MRETDKMEEVSKSYIELIANKNGYFNSTSRDYGTDMLIRKATYNEARKRYLTSGKAIDLQVKSTLNKNIREIGDFIHYYLEVKNYNDLIDRLKEKGAYIPLILIVFILPDNVEEWIDLNAERLIVRKRAYWYRITDTEIEYTENETKVVIKIPKSNIVGMDFFDTLFRNIN